MVTKYRIISVDKYSGRETHIATVRTVDQANQVANDSQSKVRTDLDGNPTATIKIVPVEMKDNQA